LDLIEHGYKIKNPSKENPPGCQGHYSQTQADNLMMVLLKVKMTVSCVVFWHYKGKQLFLTWY